MRSALEGFCGSLTVRGPEVVSAIHDAFFRPSLRLSYPMPDSSNPLTMQGVGAGVSELLRITKDGFASAERKIQGVKDDVREVRDDVQNLYKQQMDFDIRLDKVEGRLGVIENAPVENEATEAAARAAETVARSAADAARAVASAARGALHPPTEKKVSLATASKVVLASIPPPAAKNYDLGVQISDSGLHMKMPADEYKRIVTENRAAAALAREKWVIHKGLALLALVVAAFFGTLAKDCAKSIAVHHVEAKP